MTTTVRLLAQYNGDVFNTIVRLPDSVAASLISAGNATLDLAGGKNKTQAPVEKQVRGPAQLIYSTTGTFLGLGDSQGNLLLTAGGVSTANLSPPGAPTGFTLTAAAGAVIGAFSPPASNGGSPITRYELRLSDGTVAYGDGSPIYASVPAGVTVTGAAYAVNDIGTSPASNSASATPTGTSQGDTTSPVANGAAVANSTPTIVAITMSEALASTTPAASAFTVSGHTVTAVSVSGATVFLTVSPAFVNGEAARTVSYTKPGSSPIADPTGNQLASFTALAVTNNVAAAGDTTPPTVNSAAVANSAPTQVVLTMSEPMGATVPAASAFAVSGHTVSSVSISNSTIILTVDAFVNGEAARTVSYTKPGSNAATDAAGNQLASFSGVAITNNVAAVVSAMKFATTNNHIMTGTATTGSGRTKMIFREPYTVGSGDLDSITFSWLNWHSSAPDANTTATVTIDFLALENDAATEHYEFGMANGVALPFDIVAGANGVNTATVTPQQMGRAAGAKFTRGETLWLQMRGTTAAGGLLPIMVDRFGGAVTAKQLFSIYDPTQITPSPTSQTGKPTATLVAGGGATTFTVTSGGFVPIALGTFSTAYPARNPVLVGYGDSNLFGFKDTVATLPHGKGELARAATGDGTAAQLLACGNFSATGITIQGLNTDKALYWAQFADVIVDEVLCNSFGSDGTVDQALVRGYKQAIWDKYKQYNPTAKVISTGAGPHTTGAFALADQTDQTIVAGYVSGGNVETFRTWHKSKEGVSTAYNKYLEFVAWRNGPDPLKWPGTGAANENTDDGTHGTTKIVTLKAAELRTAIFAL